MLASLFLAAYWIFTMTILRYALDERAFTSGQAALLMPAASLGDLMTRFLLAVCVTCRFVSPSVVISRFSIYYALTATSVSAHILLVFYARSFGAMMALACLIGASFGGCFSLNLALVVEWFDAESVGVVLGYTYLGAALEQLFMLPLVARFSDAADSFDVAFLIAAAQWAIGAVFIALFQWRCKRSGGGGGHQFVTGL